MHSFESKQRKQFVYFLLYGIKKIYIKGGCGFTNKIFFDFSNFQAGLTYTTMIRNPPFNLKVNVDYDSCNRVAFFIWYDTIFFGTLGEVRIIGDL